MLRTFLMFLALQASAFASDWAEVRRYTAEGDYIGGLKKTQSLLDSASDPQAKNLFSQWNGFFQSYVGNYARATQRTFQFFAPPAPGAWVPTDQEISDLLSAVEVKSAVAGVCERAQSERIIIINENHHQPQHRLFGQLLLACLYDAGFRYFGFEDLKETHEEFAARRSVSRRKTGVFAAEPQMAQLIGQAYDKSFRLVKYEAETFCDTCSREDQVDQREEQQANHLVDRVFAKDPNAKLVVWVGYSHAYKYAMNASPKSRWMAARLWEKTGIEPFSVEQLSERFDRNDMQPEFGAFQRAITRNAPIYADIAGNWDRISPRWKAVLKRSRVSTQPAVDALVIHPARARTDSRADWLEFGKLVETPVHIEPIGSNLQLPILVQAWRYSSDQADGVPLDQTLASSVGDAQILTPPGLAWIYLVVRNEKGMIFSWRIRPGTEFRIQNLK